jgi:hypothetical protein
VNEHLIGSNNISKRSGWVSKNNNWSLSFTTLISFNSGAILRTMAGGDRLLNGPH